MNKNIDMLVQLLENNNIPFPKGARKKEGGSNSENKDRFHALVDGSSISSSFFIDSGSLRNMAFVQDSFSALHPYSGPYILMGDDFDIPSKAIGKIDLDNGCFNNVLYVHDLTTNLLSIYQMTHIRTTKRVLSYSR